MPRTPPRLVDVRWLTAGALSPCGFNDVRGALGRFVLPEVEDGPAELLQLAVLPGVPGPVVGQLLPPPLAIVLRQGAVFGARMPEATVHEDSDVGPGEDDVWPTGEPGRCNPES